MHFSRVRSAVGARLSAVVVCAALVAGLSACGGDGPITPTATARTLPKRSASASRSQNRS